MGQNNRRNSIFDRTKRNHVILNPLRYTNGFSSKLIYSPVYHPKSPILCFFRNFCLPFNYLHIFKHLIDNSIYHTGIWLYYWPLGGTLCHQEVSVKSILKLVLRTTKQIYNIFQNALFVACTLINDMSLLSVDVIQRTVVSQDEDIYIGLRQSALNSRNSIRRKTYVDPRSKPRGH